MNLGALVIETEGKNMTVGSTSWVHFGKWKMVVQTSARQQKR